MTITIPYLKLRAGFAHACAVLMVSALGLVSPVANAADVEIASAEGGSTYRMPVVASRGAILQPLSVQQNCSTNDATATGFARAPSDVSGAASTSVLVVVTNQDIGVYDRTTCAVSSRVPLTTLFSSFTIPPGETLFAPRVIYDFGTARFFVTAQSQNPNNTDQFQYFAVSTSSTAAAFRAFRVQLSSGVAFFCKSAANSYWNYPSAGVNSKRWFVTTNNFPFGADPPRGAFLDIDKVPTVAASALPSSAASRILRRTCSRRSCAEPRPRLFSVDRRRRRIAHSPMEAAHGRRHRGRYARRLAVTPNITIPAWTAPPDAPQPNTQRLSTLDVRFQSATIQIGTSLWQVHSINVSGQSRWRLYKLSTTGASPLFTFNPAGAAGVHYFNPSVATGAEAAGTLAFVTFTRTIPANATAGRATMMTAKGPNASATGWTYQFVEESAGQFGHTGSPANPCNQRGGSCRFGYHSATQVDPLNVAQAWGFNQLITTGNLGGLTSHFNWTTRASRVN